MIDPRPPINDVPPSTTAAITCSSKPTAALEDPEPSRAAINRPASAEATPATMYTDEIVHLDGIPTRLAASALEPTATICRPYRVVEITT